MAKSDAVWTLDIGQCSLKALRCLPDERPDRLVADAFDFIEYPKILSQPGAEPTELVADALKQFLSRNTVKGDQVALGVPGQSGLARFIKLPPVESKKIPDIVRYEARQQIPFDLADVVWDYQRMGGGSEEEGFTLETEVGLFAMKREQVFRLLEPLTNVGIEVDLVQLAPLAIYNFMVFDQMPDLGAPDEYDPENPPPSTVVLSMGTDATDLIVTNGYRVWQRSIPIGGNHFTKALTKELKLTFAKAEHLKRNATAAEDPKALFQAMRPIFHDLLTEIQRSLTFFNNLNRKAQIARVVALGNAFKLPGLRKYLSQGLGYEVQRLDAFRGLVGPQVLHTPAFKENLESFGVCYGLAVQALGKGLVTTNLLPKEIVQDRMIREKKPWAVAAAAVLMLATTLSFVSWTRALGTVDDTSWKEAEQKAKEVKDFADTWKSKTDGALSEYQKTDQIGQNLVGNVERRIVWAELLQAVNECLPRDMPGQPRSPHPADRNELYIENIEAQRIERLEDWFAAVKKWYQPPPGSVLAPAAPDAMAPPGGTPGAPGAMTPPGGTPGVGVAPAPVGMNSAVPAGGVAPVPGALPGPGNVGTDPAAGTSATSTEGSTPGPQEGPAGPGWIVRITGYHFHNYPGVEAAKGRPMAGEYVQQTLIDNLRNKSIDLPVFDSEGSGNGPGKETVTMKDLGIDYPVLVEPKQFQIIEVPDLRSLLEDAAKLGEEKEKEAPEPEALAPAVPPGLGLVPTPGVASKETPKIKMIRLLKYPFTVEFVWRQTPPSKRAEKKKAEQQAQATEAGATQPAPPGVGGPAVP